MRKAQDAILFTLIIAIGVAAAVMRVRSDTAWSGLFRSLDELNATLDERIESQQATLKKWQSLNEALNESLK